mmetsp:Transcript_64452/g.104257  ORF Transcript_64452/g.104257 Transcript_64452/m.104257 type:complete len:270 (+) Transcript_64452:68-877(+)
MAVSAKRLFLTLVGNRFCFPLPARIARGGVRCRQCFKEVTLSRYSQQRNRSCVSFRQGQRALAAVLLCDLSERNSTAGAGADHAAHARDLPHGHLACAQDLMNEIARRLQVAQKDLLPPSLHRAGPAEAAPAVEGLAVDAVAGHGVGANHDPCPPQAGHAVHGYALATLLHRLPAGRHEVSGQLLGGDVSVVKGELLVGQAKLPELGSGLALLRALEGMVQPHDGANVLPVEVLHVVGAIGHIHISCFQNLCLDGLRRQIGRPVGNLRL